MPRKVQRLGEGPSLVGALAWRASSPGACCKRSSSSSVRSKTHPMLAAVLEQPDAADAQALVPGEPLVDRIGVAGFQQPVPGHRMGGLAIGNFEQGGTALAYVGARIVIAVLDHVLTLGIG